MIISALGSIEFKASVNLANWVLIIPFTLSTHPDDCRWQARWNRCKMAPRQVILIPCLVK